MMRSGAIVTALLGLAAPSAAIGPVPYPPGTVLLLVASWCAPCRGELAQLDAIAQAAAPLTVRVMLIDDDRSGRRMVAALPSPRRWEPDPAIHAAARVALLARTPGLPYSVAIGADGRICAEQRGGLDALRARALVMRCRALHRGVTP